MKCSPNCAELLTHRLTRALPSQNITSNLRKPTFDNSSLFDQWASVTKCRLCNTVVALTSDTKAGSAVYREGTIDPLAAIQHGAMYQQNLCRLMELVLAPMLSSIQTCCSQQQLQKQFGHLGNSVYTMQRPAHSPTSQSAEQLASQSLSTSMAELLELSDPTGGLDLNTLLSDRYNSSASLHQDNSQKLQLQHQSQLQPQVLHQQYPSDTQAQTGTPAQSKPNLQVHTYSHSQLDPHYAPQVISHAESQPSAPPFHQSQGVLSSAGSQPHTSPHHQPQGGFSGQPAAQSTQEPGYMYDDPTGSQGAPNASSSLPEAAHSSGAQPLSVSIITPAVWEPQEWQHAQHGSFPSHVESAQQDHAYSALAPAASADDLKAACASSPHLSSQHLPQQLLPDTTSHFSSSLPVAGGSSKRTIATNTQLTMHRSGSHANSAGHASSTTTSVPQDVLAYQTALPGSGHHLKPQDTHVESDSGRAPLHSQMLKSKSSHSTNSLNMLPSVEGLEGRSSGQAPMRAGSPALGGQGFPKTPAWSPQMHDPFSDLVQPDLKRAGSSHSSANMS